MWDAQKAARPTAARSVYKTTMEIIIITLLYFGGLLIPTIYFFATRLKGLYIKPILLGFCLQIFWTICVWQYTLFCKYAGYREWYWNWGLLYIVNFISILYYLSVYIWFKRKERDKTEQ